MAWLDFFNKLCTNAAFYEVLWKQWLDRQMHWLIRVKNTLQIVAHEIKIGFIKRRQIAVMETVDESLVSYNVNRISNNIYMNCMKASVKSFHRVTEASRC